MVGCGGNKGVPASQGALHEMRPARGRGLSWGQHPGTRQVFDAIEGPGDTPGVVTFLSHNCQRVVDDVEDPSQLGVRTEGHGAAPAGQAGQAHEGCPDFP